MGPIQVARPNGDMYSCAAHNKQQTDARGLMLAGCSESKDLLKLFLAHTLAQCRAASSENGGGGTALRFAADVMRHAPTGVSGGRLVCSTSGGAL
jgi:hypothetical protein